MKKQKKEKRHEKKIFYSVQIVDAGSCDVINFGANSINNRRKKYDSGYFYHSGCYDWHTSGCVEVSVDSIDNESEKKNIRKKENAVTETKGEEVKGKKEEKSEGWRIYCCECKTPLGVLKEGKTKKGMEFVCKDCRKKWETLKDIVDLARNNAKDIFKDFDFGPFKTEK